VSADNLTIAEVAVATAHKRGAVQRWIKQGVQANGRTVKLSAERIGGRFTVARAALDAFKRACNPDREPLPETPDARQHRADAAVRRARRLVAGEPAA